MKFLLDRTVAGNPKCSAEAALLVYVVFVFVVAVVVGGMAVVQ